MKALSLVLLATVICARSWADDRDVVINEIMYHPARDRENLQYIELFNRGSTPVNLAGWSFTKGVRFSFPTGARLGPSEFLVICRSTNDFFGEYGRDLPASGNFSGKLSHRGDHLELVNAHNQVVDSVKYSDRGDWPMAPDGHSASLERICPSSGSDRADNWAGSKPSLNGRGAGTPGRANDNLSTSLPPSITSVSLTPQKPMAQQETTVTASVSDADGVAAVTLLYRIMGEGGDSSEKSAPMTRTGGDDHNGKYTARIGPVPASRLVRYRFKAVDSLGVERIYPALNEPRSTFSYSTFANTNQAHVPFGYVLHVDRAAPAPRLSRARVRAPQSGVPPRAPAARASSAFVYVPPNGGEVQTFDHVQVRARKGGFKVHFLKDQLLNGMSAINIIFEGAPRWILAEPLAYEVYRLANVPAPRAEHIRIFMGGHYRGYYLLIEQPNKSFLARHFQDDSGNLYKLLWYGRTVAEKHEKKTNHATDHEDLLRALAGLNRAGGAAQWDFIQKNFNVDELASYFAVNMCIQNWDGFFNNYFTYHDTGRTGKWLVIPWDEDKTWGDYDGASLPYSWYEMPLTYGMNSDRPGSRFFAQGPWGGASWWRPPGPFSGPLLANPEFRKRFLDRLREICETVFTEQKLLPVINAMENRLAPEVPLRAQILGENPRHDVQVFRADMQSFRDQVKNRRKFILAEIQKERRL